MNQTITTQMYPKLLMTKKLLFMEKEGWNESQKSYCIKKLEMHKFLTRSKKPKIVFCTCIEIKLFKTKQQDKQNPTYLRKTFSLTKSQKNHYCIRKAFQKTPKRISIQQFMQIYYRNLISNKLAILQTSYHGQSCTITNTNTITITITKKNGARNSSGTKQNQKKKQRNILHGQ